MSEEVQRTLKDQYMLRLPDGMRDRIKAVAQRNGRSMNVEIVAALEHWLQISEAYQGNGSQLLRSVMEAGITEESLESRLNQLSVQMEDLMLSLSSIERRLRSTVDDGPRASE